MVNPTTSTQNLGAKAIRNDPSERRITLHWDNVKSLMEDLNFHFRSRAVVTVGIITRYRTSDTIPLNENKSPAYSTVSNSPQTNQDH